MSPNPLTELKLPQASQYGFQQMNPLQGQVDLGWILTLLDSSGVNLFQPSKP